MRVYEAVDYILADNYLGEEEVANTLEPSLQTYVPTDEKDRAALARLGGAFNNPAIGMSRNAANRLFNDLISKGVQGLAPPAQRSTVVPQMPRGLVPKAENGAPLSGADPVFERLGKLVGHGIDDGGVYIGVADRAVDFRHPALAGHEYQKDQKQAWDFVHNSVLVPERGQFHGTANAVIGIQGAPRLRLIASEVMPAMDFAPLLRLATPSNPTGGAIVSSIARGARVINLATTMFDPLHPDDNKRNAERLAEIIRANPKVVFCMAAGNEGQTISEANAAALAALPVLDNLIVVGGSNRQGGVWQVRPGLGSNRGAPWVTLSANAESVAIPYSMDQVADGNVWDAADGTSFACPQVSNCAGKMMLLCPDLEPKWVRFLMIQTVDKTEHWSGMNAAGGILNPTRAMTAAAALTLIREKGYTIRAALLAAGCREADVLPLARSISFYLTTTGQPVTYQ